MKNPFSSLLLEPCLRLVNLTRVAALLLGAGLALPAWSAMTVNASNGTVTDTTTGLVWEQCAQGLSGPACTTGTAATFTWVAALTAAATANSGVYKGYSDWRLPNVNELESIAKVDSNPSIDGTAFPATPTDKHYWTSTTLAIDPINAWFVDFLNAIINVGNKTDTYYVRLVRSGQSLASFDAFAVAPAAPATPTATAGNTTASVTITPPVDNGGSAITGYTVVSSPAGGVDSDAGTTALTHTITGLGNGTPYTFTVTATNAVGTSGASPASNGVTPISGPSAIITGATKIATGSAHTCAVTGYGGVKCWGSNANGEVGDNSTTNRLAAVDVIGLTSGVTAIAAGSHHTCAVTSTGGVKCWGNNGSGQLGDNSTTNRLAAVDVIGLTSGVTAIAAGAAHTCALTTTGGVKCWGQNAFGQLGDNSTTNHLTAVDVSNLASGVTAIAVGDSHTCALTSTGGVKCWGRNANGQLGDNSVTNRLTAVDVIDLTSGVTAIDAGGTHTCARTSTGGVKCWGYNFNGQLGDNSTSQRLTAADVSGLTGGVTAIAAGSDHTCALTGGGGVKCWGGNASGQLGDNSTTQRLIAVDVSGLNGGATAIAAGSGHTCALHSSGTVKCWGLNFAGELGDGTVNSSLVPVASTELVPTKTSQTITFGPTPSVQVGGTGTVSATATSGLTVAFSAAPSSAGKCTISGSTVTGVAVGLCSVYADQAGDATYAPAPQGVMAFTITAGPTSPPSAPTNLSITSGPGRATLAFSAPTSDGGAPIVSYTATCTASGQTTRTATGSGSPLDVYGLTASVSYTCSVTANNGSYNSTASDSAVVTPGQVVDLTPILMLLLD